jgi:periplasmic divalent cation tolerance protein
LTHILVHTTLPDEDTARDIARALVEGRLAACVSIGAPVDSLYHWRGTVESGREIPLVAKTRADRFDAVAAAIRARHPYELPEIVAVPITRGTSDYLDWIGAETAPR